MILVNVLCVLCFKCWEKCFRLFFYHFSEPLFLLLFVNISTDVVEFSLNVLLDESILDSHFFLLFKNFYVVIHFISDWVFSSEHVKLFSYFPLQTYGRTFTDFTYEKKFRCVTIDKFYVFTN